MENVTSSPREWEYYYDYIDPVIVDEKKLKYNKCKYFFHQVKKKCFNVWWELIDDNMKMYLLFSDSIVILFWITLIASVGFLFFTLNLISWGGTFPAWVTLKNRNVERTSFKPFFFFK